MSNLAVLLSLCASTARADAPGNIYVNEPHDGTLRDAGFPDVQASSSTRRLLADDLCRRQESQACKGADNATAPAFTIF